MVLGKSTNPVESYRCQVGNVKVQEKRQGYEQYGTGGVVPENRRRRSMEYEMGTVIDDGVTKSVMLGILMMTSHDSSRPSSPFTIRLSPQ